MESVRTFEDEIDECLMKRFIQDTLCLPAKHSERIKIVINDQFKEYYINLYKTELAKLSNYGTVNQYKI